MEISELPNLGVKSQAMLEQAGIHSVEQLRQLGAVHAYVQVRRSGVSCSLNLLWAMEGALTGRPWQEVVKHDRLSLLLAMERVEEE